MKGMWTESGLEAETNDGKVKYILRKVKYFTIANGMEQTVYNSAVFVRFGSSWVQSIDSGSSYETLQDFLNQIVHIPELTIAYTELTDHIRRT